MFNILSKSLIFLGLFFISFNAIGQKTTNNDYTGQWTDNASWVGGIAADITNIGGENLTIEGYINVGDNTTPISLGFAANNDTYDLLITDTLIVYGDMSFANKSMNLVISNNALLIVLGDLIMNNKIDIASNGSIIVNGTLDKNGSQGSFTGTGSVYATTYSGDASALIPDASEKDTSTDLAGDLPDVFDFLTDNGIVPLPIELLYFEVTGYKTSNNVNWSTTLEFNFDYFILEKSNDGFNFKQLIDIKGGYNVYGYIDTTPYNGLNYYRLKQIDLDGTFEYSKIIMNWNANVPSLFEIYPNPITVSYFIIKTNVIFNNQSSLTILSTSGEEIFTIKPITGIIAIPTHVKNGRFFVQITHENIITTIQLVLFR